MNREPTPPLTIQEARRMVLKALMEARAAGESM